eukprot:TRINITY_DN2402_c0_g2_i2.p1 TRINITY_DN2402_c0_g2~~TRINITY_DN2402_c0_g2_i2.p1  ORF type:complete len:266 (-),score=71.25 TRINITY_DN2402_c0_g2_i2:17-814(-)
MNILKYEQHIFSNNSLFKQIVMTGFVGCLHAIPYECIWLITDLACICSGLSLNPNFSTIDDLNNLSVNILPFKTLFSPNVNETFKAWNIKVSKWLFKYINRSFGKTMIKNDKKKTISTPFSLLMTFGFSALWHGIKPGYYIFFACCFLSVIVFKNFNTKVTPLIKKSSKIVQIVYTIIGYILSRSCPSFFIYFFALSFAEAHSIYSRIYYFPFVVLLSLLLVSFVIPTPKHVADKSKVSKAVDVKQDHSIIENENSLPNDKSKIE